MRALIIIAAVALEFAVQTIAEEPYGFDGIPFGSHREVVIGALVEKLDMAPKGYVSAPPYWSPQWMDLYINKRAILLTNYSLDGSKYDVSLFFNQNDKFCGFTLKGKSKSQRKVFGRKRDEIIGVAAAAQKISGAPPIPMVFCDDGRLKNAGAGAPVNGHEEHAVIAGMVYKNANRPQKTRLIPVCGIWHNQLHQESELPQPYELTKSQLKAQIASIVGSKENSAVATAEQQW